MMWRAVLVFGLVCARTTYAGFCPINKPDFPIASRHAVAEVRSVPAHPLIDIHPFSSAWVEGAPFKLVDRGDVCSLEIDIDRGDVLVAMNTSYIIRYHIGGPLLTREAIVKDVERHLNPEGWSAAKLTINSNATMFRVEWSDGRTDYEHNRREDDTSIIWLTRPEDAADRVRIIAIFADRSELEIFDARWHPSWWSRITTAPRTRHILFAFVLIGLVIVAIRYRQSRGF